jgi:hypothetical protein
MPRHVVVDGSNIATEGRTMPSLRQLNDAVLAFMEEFPDDLITVVVDATFGHRIDSTEVPDFDAAVENNEVVSPPAGAVGRGDAFVLAIANKVHATILSNDSYQEFHGDHDWLFDEGRLLGGKPVPNVGWVFVARTPVRGPLSRRAVRDAKKGPTRGRAPRPSKLASEPLPIPKTPPPKAAVAKAHSPVRVKDAERAATAAPPKAPGTPAPVNPKNAPVNELLVFIDFVEKHPVGSVVNAIIESFSSHGAYAMAGPARCYVPLRFMGSPAPRSARDVVKLGDERSLVVVSFNAARRGIDAALEGFEPAEVVRVPAATKARKRTKKAEAPEPAPTPTPEPVVKKRVAKKAKAVAEPAPEGRSEPPAPAASPQSWRQAREGHRKAAAVHPELPPRGLPSAHRRPRRSGAATAKAPQAAVEPPPSTDGGQVRAKGRSRRLSDGWPWAIACPSCATWNVNSLKVRMRNRSVARRRTARHRVPAGDEARRRRLPRPCLRDPRLHRGPLWPGPVERGGRIVAGGHHRRGRQLRTGYRARRRRTRSVGTLRRHPRDQRVRPQWSQRRSRAIRLQARLARSPTRPPRCDHDAGRRRRRRRRPTSPRKTADVCRTLRSPSWGDASVRPSETLAPSRLGSSRRVPACTMSSVYSWSGITAGDFTGAGMRSTACAGHRRCVACGWSIDPTQRPQGTRHPITPRRRRPAEATA